MPSGAASIVDEERGVLDSLVDDKATAGAQKPPDDVHKARALGVDGRVEERIECPVHELFCRLHLQKGSLGLTSAHSSEPCGNQLPMAGSENQRRAMDQTRSGTIVHFINDQRL
jgi:hypothetical protein